MSKDLGLKISLPGYDVLDATPEQCAVHSSYPPLKAKAEQDPPHFATLIVDFTAQVSQNVNHVVYSIPHGYNYVCSCLASISFRAQDGTVREGVGLVNIGATLSIECYTTEANFRVRVYDNNGWTGPNARLEVSYYVFAEDG